jgi:carbamoyl-phosphate synthase small subunit
MVGAHLADEVSTAEPYVVRPDRVPRFRVVAVDLGIKSMTPARMAERGLEVHVVPSTISVSEIEALHPDGVFFSNGPGDPGAADPQVAVLRALLAARIPYFGICFGNQLFGRALGFGTFKLGYGHRGINQPVMDLTTRKVEVTAHNHGFAVAAAPGERHQTPYGIAEVSHICLNDDVVEGLQLTDADGTLLAFSVQYHPEAAAGPHDASYLFDRFVDLMATHTHPVGPNPTKEDSPTKRPTKEGLLRRNQEAADAKRRPRSSDGEAVDVNAERSPRLLTPEGGV